jgi:hypothetical protein
MAYDDIPVKTNTDFRMARNLAFLANAGNVGSVDGPRVKANGATFDITYAGRTFTVYVTEKKQ